MGCGEENALRLSLFAFRQSCEFILIVSSGPKRSGVEGPALRWQLINCMRTADPSAARPPAAKAAAERQRRGRSAQDGKALRRLRRVTKSSELIALAKSERRKAKGDRKRAAWR